MNDKLIIQIREFLNGLLYPLEGHYYHHYKHALDVSNRAYNIGLGEGLNGDDLEMLLIAGLFHDSGFIIQYDNNEYIGAKIAQNYLKSILYPMDKIESIEKLIIATIPTREPINYLEKIIKDRDMDNLGRDDFFEKGNNLKAELEAIKNIKILDPDWIHNSINLMKNHKFYTQTAQNERSNKKNENLKKLQNDGLKSFKNNN